MAYAGPTEATAVDEDPFVPPEILTGMLRAVSSTLVATGLEALDQLARGKRRERIGGRVGLLSRRPLRRAVSARRLRRAAEQRRRLGLNLGEARRRRVS